jgi:hypothetical protein
MHPEIEKLIDLALADGKITENERAVIYKKAMEFGISAEEIDLVLDAKKHLQHKAVLGNQVKCPACGALNSGIVKTCLCGYVFNTGTITDSKSLESSIEILENLIIDVRSLSSSSSNEHVESLIARVEKEIRYIRTRYADNLEVKKLLSELELLSEKYISKSQKKIKNRRLIYVALICLVLGIIGFRLFQKLTYKTKQEQFAEAVSDNYMDKYRLYAESNQYKSDLSDFTTLFEESRLASNFTDSAIRDSINAIWEQWGNSNQISEFKLYAKASKCILNNDFNNAKLYIDTATVLNPKFPAIYYLKSKTYSDLDSSIELLSKAIELDSKISYVYLPYRCEAYANKGEFDKSLADINLYLEKYPKNRVIDLGRVVGRISILINMGLKEQGCVEFNKLDKAQMDNIKVIMPDEYSQLLSYCK